MKIKVLAMIVSVMFCAAAVTMRATESNWLGNPRAEDTLSTFWRFIMRLEVGDAQKTEIRALLASHQQQGDKIRANAALSPQVRQSSIETLNRTTHAKVLEKLTSPQRQQLKHMPGFQP
jgi:hypothetical protein